MAMSNKQAWFLLAGGLASLAILKAQEIRGIPSTGPGSGTVTSVATGCGLTGGTITATGTLSGTGPCPSASVGGTADAITAVYSPVRTTLFTGEMLSFTPAAPNATTTPTFAPDGLTAHTIVKAGAAALVAGDIATNVAAILKYDATGTRWELQNPQTGLFPSAAAAVDHIGQTGSLSFSLLASPVTGNYLLTDYLSVTTAAGDADLSYNVSWADQNGAVSLGGSVTPNTQTGSASLQAVATGVFISNNITYPTTVYAVSGTPVAITLTVTPSAVATATPTAMNLGLGYAVNDTGTIDTGSGTATYKVLTLADSMAGTVGTVSVTAGGSGYTVSNGNATTGCM